jgi:cysteinyl-tRNA synthetase
LRNVRHATAAIGKSNDLKKTFAETKRKFAEAMNNDFNTPLALTQLFILSKKANKLISTDKINSKLADEIIGTFKELGAIFGILEKELEGEKIPKEVEQLIKEREEARKKKDWKRADEIRKKIQELGYSVEDTVEGVRWKKLS